ncbi:MAG: hypothetical protein IJ083_03235 [Clostridia bacterium]|nr:hypothetical protein [Clostridia bacterium]
MTPRKTVVYHDPLKDDFARTVFHAEGLPENFRYIHDRRSWRAFATVLWCVALPLVFIINYGFYGMRVKNRKALKKVKREGGGWFLYGNHSHGFPNATMPSLLAFPKRAYVLANPDALALPVLKTVTQMLGAFPVPFTVSEHRAFLRAMDKRLQEEGAFAVYPEAHIWPYYTGVRPFPDTSFAYPVRYQKPVIACSVTYRKRLLPFLPPALTLHLSDPIYPDAEKPVGEARKQLHRAVYDFLTEHARENEVEYYRYVQADDPTHSMEETT